MAQTQGAPVKDDRTGKGFKQSRWVISRFFAEGKTINFNASLIALGCAAAVQNERADTAARRTSEVTWVIVLGGVGGRRTQ